MNVLKLLWLRLQGKRTYAALGLLMLNELATALGVQLAEGEANSAINVVLIILAGMGRLFAQPAPADRPPGVPK